MLKRLPLLADGAQLGSKPHALTFCSIGTVCLPRNFLSSNGQQERLGGDGRHCGCMWARVEHAAAANHMKAISKTGKVLCFEEAES